jgi:glycosyltransferase involved in cell wall biosynthesis
VASVAKEQDLQDCCTMIKELDLQGHVDILTERPFEEVPPFLTAADVTVVCRPTCPVISVKLLNYMAAGKPTVVFEGSAKGLQHMKHLFVVRDHDWQLLGQGIITLLQDPVLAKTLGQNARQWVSENLCWTKLAEKIEDIYYDLLGLST